PGISGRRPTRLGRQVCSATRRTYTRSLGGRGPIAPAAATVNPVVPLTHTLNTNSAFYRFLCFYKIIEGIPFRRSRTNEAAKQAGKQVRRFHEVLPSTRDELIALLKDV